MGTGQWFHKEAGSAATAVWELRQKPLLGCAASYLECKTSASVPRRKLSPSPNQLLAVLPVEERFGGGG